LERLVCGLPAFINIPSYLLTDPALELLPKERVVFEILEETEPTAEALTAAHSLAEKGYRLALDDFVMGSPQEEFLSACKIVKLDLLANKSHVIPAGLQKLKKSRLRVLAEKVETMSAYARCQALGFDYFQGYFFARPDIVSSRGVPASRTVLIHLLTRLQEPRVTIHELEELVSADVTLTYRLLRLVNSACLSLNHEIDSVRTALLVLGIERVVALVSLLAMSGVQDKTNELIVTAMIRAKMCESVATILGFDNTQTHFTVGLLSVLEAMFDTPMSVVMEQLPLAPDLKAALVDPRATGPLAETLRITLRFEAGEWDALEDTIVRAGSIGESYVGAVTWAEDARMALAA
jgi:EAL and modified HD-GYP domain-containing signal transduction protein